GEVRRVPRERQPADLSQAAERQDELLRLARRGIAPPASRRRQRRLARGKRLERQLVDPERSVASRLRGDRDLDRAEPADLAAASGAPGEGDATLRDRDGRPLARKLEAVADRPPDVFAAFVDELELER